MSYKLTVGEKGKISYERINVSGKIEMKSCLFIFYFNINNINIL